METPVSPSKQNPNPNSPSPSPSPLRLWRPAAQRNVRNQWSKLHSSKDRWFAAGKEGRSHATSLVNSHLSKRYLPNMDLGALKDMPGIRQNASEKLARRQEVCCSNLLSSYKNMVAAVSHMVQSSRSMRCFLKASGVNSIVQFCDHPEDVNDPGDGGGIPVFSFLSISNFEDLANELVEMFLLEMNLKRLLVTELLSCIYEQDDGKANPLDWFHELYHGEFDDLKTSNMLSEENSQPLPPKIKDWPSGNFLTGQLDDTQSHEVLQVYLTTWLADVNINRNRMHEIFSVIEDELQVKLS